MDSERAQSTSKIHADPTVHTKGYGHTAHLPVDLVEIKLNDGLSGPRGDIVNLGRGLIGSGETTKKLGKARVGRQDTVGPSSNHTVLKVLVGDFLLGDTAVAVAVRCQLEIVKTRTLVTEGGGRNDCAELKIDFSVLEVFVGDGNGDTVDLILETTATTESNVTRLALALHLVADASGGTSRAATLIRAGVVNSEEDFLSVNVCVDAVGSTSTVGVPAVLGVEG